MLDNIAYIVKILRNFKTENYKITGKFYNLSQDDISNLRQVWKYVEECIDLDGKIIYDEYLDNFINHDIEIQITTGNIKGYFDTFCFLTY